MFKTVLAIIFSFFWFSAYCQIGQVQNPTYNNMQPIQMGSNAQNINNQQNRNHNVAIQNSNNYQRQKELKQLQRDINEVNPKHLKQNIPENEKVFYEAFSVLNNMSNNFLLAEAIYIVENAYYNKQYSKDDFYSSIKVRAELCKQILKSEHLPTNNSLTINYAIQKLYQQNNKYYNSLTGRTTTIPRLTYDFNDFMGDTSYAQMFVTKLFSSGKGQCHSLPFLYLLLAEQLGAKAYLSNAPEHSFIRFPDTAGRLYNFETTSGVLVSDKFMMQSGFINVTAIKNKIYLDTLSKQQLLATCLVDLANEYVFKFGYNSFVEEVTDRILQLYPNCIQGHMLRANIANVKLEYYAKKEGAHKEEDLKKNPHLYALYQARQKQYDIIDVLGYQDMPKEAYKDWLKSVESEKNIQQAQEMKQQLKYQIQYSKVKVITKNKK